MFGYMSATFVWNLYACNFFYIFVQKDFFSSSIDKEDRSERRSKTVKEQEEKKGIFLFYRHQYVSRSLLEHVY